MIHALGIHRLAHTHTHPHTNRAKPLTIVPTQWNSWVTLGCVGIKVNTLIVGGCMFTLQNEVVGN